jgi:hypothetical protein
MLAGRYRIVGLLGRGGMGEVYRADDVKLGQTVALKFLPRGLERDPNRLSRFLNEVRVARQVTHPNVCRVYDIAETESQHFLSMEYIDGEDLASLLRRIGRLPEDKATQIARQLCAGLAAAHEQGILHRDLKPANVMIDGRGRARITDFGLAGWAEVLGKAGAPAGTPAYMAPEQLAGKGVSARSDLYSLGLVLHELFTGEPLFKASSIDEIRRLHEQSTPTSMTSRVEHLDPAIDRAVSRCLEREPEMRPASAQAVAAALPGGDPLAAALAAGETPSPDMVAAAGATGTISAAVALRYGVAIVLGFAVALVSGHLFALHKALPELKPPAVLEDRARTLIDELNPDTAAVDRAFGYAWNTGYLSTLPSVPLPQLGQQVQGDPPAALEFWYRQSPSQMVPLSHSIMGNYGYRVTEMDPAPTVPGMAWALLSASGKLVAYRSLPPDFVPDEPPPTPVDWARLFDEAGLSIDQFEEVAPIRTPPVASDARRAWLGSYPDAGDLELRVEGATLQGRVVHFELFGPWLPADNAAAAEDRAAQARARVTTTSIVASLIFSVILASLWLARIHLRAGRADRRGALRLTVGFFTINLAAWVLDASHAGQLGPDVQMLLSAMSWAMGRAILTAALYLALEPFVRRNWPHTIISWSRLLGGRWRDPLIGRDVLAGLAAFGVSVVVIAGIFLTTRVGGPNPSPGVLDALTSVRHTVASMLGSLNSAVGNSLMLLVVLVFLRRFVRPAWLAGTLWAAVIAGFNSLLFGGGTAGLTLALVTALAFAILVHRYGLLSLFIYFYAFMSFGVVPLTLDFSIWYAPATWVLLALFGGLTVYGFATAIGQAGRTSAVSLHS